MANVVARDASEKKSSPDAHEVKPFSGWKDDSDCHWLLIDLPGFEKDHVKLETDDNSNIVTVNAERNDSENNYMSFKQSYKVPENSKIEEADGKYEHGILYVIIPKKTRTPNDSYESYTSSSSDDDEDDDDDDESYESSTEDEDLVDASNNHNTGIENQSNRGELLEELIKRLKKNRIVVAITAALAISLGVFVSQKMNTNEPRALNK